MRSRWLRSIRAAAAVAAAAALFTPVQIGNAAADGGFAERMAKANDLYESGEYAKALEIYEGLVEDGAVDPDLFYNLGNAYYKEGRPGRAVLYYKRALRLAPRDEDAQTNLHLVSLLLRDKQFINRPGILNRLFAWPHRNLNVQESFVAASILYFCLSFALLGFIFRDSKFMIRVYDRLSVVSPGRLLGLDKKQDFLLAIFTCLFLATTVGYSAASKYKTATERRQAIVIVDEAPVYGGPSEDSTLQFKIHEGTEVTSVERRHGWVHIRLPGDLFGWVEEESVEQI